MKRIFVFLFFINIGQSFYAQDIEDLDLLDSSDVNILIEEENRSQKIEEDIDLSELEEVDDLESLKNDIGEIIFEDEIENEKTDKIKPIQKVSKQEKKIDIKEIEDQILIDENGVILNDEEVLSNPNAQRDSGKSDSPEIFSIGEAEKELLELSKFVEGKIPTKEWDEIATASKLEKYVIQEGDWLWKISKQLFGSGFYYSKIWSLNPQITNPHEIEPGMTLAFTTGDADSMPNVRVDDFNGIGGADSINFSKNSKKQTYIDFEDFGEGVKPSWIDERKRLREQGVFFQFASDETYEDLKKLAKGNLKSEYKKYTPPVPDIVIKEPGALYDNSGFDKNSKIVFDVKEGFFLNTFVTTNIVQDLGEIVGMGKENVFIQSFDKVFVEFDSAVKVKPGDQFSIYIPGGPVKHKVSDRTGYKYTIGAQIKALKKINQRWQCLVEDLTGVVQRGDRITVYTPKIGKIIKTFNTRNIEAAIIGSFLPRTTGMSFGDVVYLDRGRADGVEMGNVFDLYSFMDKGTEKRLTPDPSYKTGEVTVISLTDNFATALISNSSEPIAPGTIALTKTQEEAALATSVKIQSNLIGLKEIENKALDELDIELNLDDLSKDLLEKADQVQLTEDELEELERQERERSIIKDHERDLNELEKLESEIIDAESSLNEAKVDEDKFLEQQNLNSIEGEAKSQNPEGFGSLNDIEEEVGLKFLDENLNTKENPYGLTEFDLEEIDELLNTESL